MKKIILLNTIVLTALIFACKKQQPQMSEDIKNPCDCAHEVSAEFKMEVCDKVYYEYAKNIIETDSIYAERNVWFTALEEDAEYTWYIGAEVIHDKNFFRYFDASLVGLPALPMTLVVKKQPNYKCYPDDDGYDSITKYLTVAEVYDSYNFFYANPQPKWEGTFRMKGVNQSDSIDIKVDLGDGWNIYGGLLGERVNFYNYNGLGDSTNFGTYTVNYNMINFTENENGLYSNLDNSFFKRDYQTGIYEFYAIPNNAVNNLPTLHYYGRKIN
jgi:hypothetical protein